MTFQRNLVTSDSGTIRLHHPQQINTPAEAQELACRLLDHLPPPLQQEALEWLANRLLAAHSGEGWER